MNYNEPTAEQIKALKELHADRSLHLVEFVDKSGDDGEDVYFFVMTGTNRVEYKKYTDDVITADAKGGTARVDSIRTAIENTAKAMIRHPIRAEVERIINLKPAALELFAEEIQKQAGSTVEVRSKKL